MIQIIAEFCQNHNGDFGLLTEMVNQAAGGGATHGKMQTIFADELTHRPEFETGLTEDGQVKYLHRPYQQEYERLKKLELGWEQHLRFIEICHRAGLIPMTTCFTRAQVPYLVQMPFSVVKVASYDCGSLPLIRSLAQHFETLYLSTGATLDLEIEATAGLLQKLGKDFSFLHCVTSYPTALEDLNLARLEYLRQFTPQVGFSDHSLVNRDGVYASLLAIHLGATVIERHFTILPANLSKDGPVSIRPEHLRELVSFAKMNPGDRTEYLIQKAPARWAECTPPWRSALGLANRELTPTEWANRRYYRGRFASKTPQGMVYNWEDQAI